MPPPRLDPVTAFDGDGAIVLRQARWKVGLTGALCLLVTAVAVWMMVEAGEVAWVGVGLLLILLPLDVLLVLALVRPGRLTVAPDGLTLEAAGPRCA